MQSLKTNALELNNSRPCSTHCTANTWSSPAALLRQNVHGTKKKLDVGWGYGTYLFLDATEMKISHRANTVMTMQQIPSSCR